MPQEENKSVNENKESSELNASPSEFYEGKESASTAEYYSLAEDSTGKAIKKSKHITNSKTAAQAASATAVIGLASFVIISTSGLINVTMDGVINDIQFQDNGIRYNITVSDVEKDNDLYFEVFKGSKSVAKYDIVFDHPEKFDGDLEGFISISDLEIDKKIEANQKVEYDFHLCGDTGLVNRTYSSWTLEVTSFESVFNTITYGCDCGNSGCFLFTMDYKDDNGVFTDFTASITDSLGVNRKCEFSDNLHAQQKIWVLDLAGGDAKFEVSYKMDGTEVTKTYDVTI